MARNVQVIPAQQELKQKSVNTKNGFDIAMTPPAGMNLSWKPPAC